MINHSRPVPGKGDAPYMAGPWLYINHNGERFLNEETPYWLMGAHNVNQPVGDGLYFQMLDDLAGIFKTVYAAHGHDCKQSGNG